MDKTKAILKNYPTWARKTTGELNTSLPVDDRDFAAKQLPTKTAQGQTHTIEFSLTFKNGITIPTTNSPQILPGK